MLKPVQCLKSLLVASLVIAIASCSAFPDMETILQKSTEVVFQWLEQLDQVSFQQKQARATLMLIRNIQLGHYLENSDFLSTDQLRSEIPTETESYSYKVRQFEILPDDPPALEMVALSKDSRLRNYVLFTWHVATATTGTPLVDDPSGTSSLLCEKSQPGVGSGFHEPALSLPTNLDAYPDGDYPLGNHCPIGYVKATWD